MSKITFKHWKTGVEKTINFRRVDIPLNPMSDRMVVWNEDENKMEDIIKETIVRIEEDDEL